VALLERRGGVAAVSVAGPARFVKRASLTARAIRAVSRDETDSQERRWSRERSITGAS